MEVIRNAAKLALGGRKSIALSAAGRSYSYGQLLLSAWDSLGKLESKNSKSTPVVVCNDATVGTATQWEDFAGAGPMAPSFKLQARPLDGARIGIMAKPCAEFVVSLYVTWLGGAVAVPLALNYPEAELMHVIQDAEVSIIMVTEEYTGQFENICRKCSADLFVLPPVLSMDFSALDSDLPDVDENFMKQFSPLMEVEDHKAGLIIYTSGTTGRPKGVVHTHGGMASQVPTMYVRLIQGYDNMDPLSQEKCASAAHKLRLMMCGSSALPQPIMTRWEIITKHRLLERYGMTEDEKLPGGLFSKTWKPSKSHDIKGHVITRGDHSYMLIYVFEACVVLNDRVIWSDQESTQLQTMESLNQLEVLCERLYNSQDPAERGHAESTLKCFSTNTEYISQCQFILQSSNSPYAHLLASSSLVKQVTEHSLSLPLRLDIRNYIVGYLASKGQELQPFVTSSLIQLLCRITKLGWNDDDGFRDIIKDATKFMSQGTVEHFYIGLKILNQLVIEMNQPGQANAGLSLAHHRKISCSFRDLALLQTFQISLTSLDQLKGDATDERLREQAIGLALKCLSFDFVGASQDESSEDLGTIQIPSSWRNLLEDSATMQLFFDYYACTKPPLSNQALECLVRFASVRRSLFSSETERAKFLSHLMSGTREILRAQQGLSEHENYHEYCRLLGRLKTNYQLAELVNVENYGEWVQFVAEFTIRSLHSWQWASGSVYYLLGLWSRLVSSLPYLKSDSPSLLDGYVPKITEAYITSRFDSVQALLQNNMAEDPLDNEEQLQDQLDSLPYLCRFQYEKTSSYIISLLDPILLSYREATRLPTSVESSNLHAMEGQLTWLVHIVGAIVKGRQSSSTSAELHETIDGDLSARVFQLIQIIDTGFHVQRCNERSKQHLDVAILSFFQNFRRVYVGDQAVNSSKQLYARLTELCGLQDHLMVLNLMVGKIATDLKYYTQCEQVIEQALNLFQELTSGHMSGKLLLKLDAVNFILTHHTREHFPFLDEYSSSRNRTTFYFTIGRLLFMEDSSAKFKVAIAPLQQVFLNLEATPDNSFRVDGVKYALIGLFRDLRGIAMATNSRRTFGLLFDWLYPAHMPLLLRAASNWVDTPEVTTPLLKFMAEFVVNKTQRLTFDPSSPNGILLFREVSKLLVAYGNGVMALPPPPDKYLYKYKGIWIALLILTRALAGNYVNFGVFELYGDPALSNALDVALKMALSIPLSDIMSYRKLARAYFALLEVLFHNHINVVINLDTGTFAHIVGSLESGLRSLEANISSQCASAVDNIAAFYFNNITTGEAPTTPAALKLTRHVADLPHILPEILRSLFEIVLFEECGNQWSFSRPMLSLILVNEQIYNDMKMQILATKPPDQQQRLLVFFDKLMTDVSRTLEPKNRDKFTQNLTMCRQEFAAK